MMATREQDVRLADGRVLRVLDTGAADGQPVVVFYGTPAYRRLHEVWVTAAQDAGLRLISYDRPGYGGSTPGPAAPWPTPPPTWPPSPTSWASTGSPYGAPQVVARTRWPVPPG